QMRTMVARRGGRSVMTGSFSERTDHSAARVPQSIRIDGADGRITATRLPDVPCPPTTRDGRCSQPPFLPTGQSVADAGRRGIMRQGAARCRRCNHAHLAGTVEKRKCGTGPVERLNRPGRASLRFTLPLLLPGTPYQVENGVALERGR